MILPEKITISSIFQLILSTLFSRFYKPILFSDLELFQSSLLLLVDILLLFVLQEVVISNSGVKASIANSLKLVKNNFFDSCVLWIVASLLFLVIPASLASISFAFLKTNFASYFIKLGIAISFLSFVILQTNFYLTIKDKLK